MPDLDTTAAQVNEMYAFYRRLLPVMGPELERVEAQRAADAAAPLSEAEVAEHAQEITDRRAERDANAMEGATAEADWKAAKPEPVGADRQQRLQEDAGKGLDPEPVANHEQAVGALASGEPQPQAEPTQPEPGLVGNDASGSPVPQPLPPANLSQ